MKTQYFISIHALLAESDSFFGLGFPRTMIFLSTLSLRRATHAPNHNPCRRNNFYPRSPCGERHNINSSVNTADKISIHALLAESDWLRCWQLAARDISIHALLAESDRSNSTKLPTGGHFYPRSPCGERLAITIRGLVAPVISIHALLAESDRDILVTD